MTRRPSPTLYSSAMLSKLLLFCDIAWRCAAAAAAAADRPQRYRDVVTVGCSRCDAMRVGCYFV